VRVLLIDDSKTMRMIERAALEQVGAFEFEEAHDGLDALSKVVAFKPDLILVDWDMPVMDGLTFVRHFRAQDQRTPVVMVTTESERTRVLEAIEAGVNNYIVKPLTPRVLAERLRETIGSSAAA
jgi:two-component system, chemotaxis family, chemotaxis protein CheY